MEGKDWNFYPSATKIMETEIGNALLDKNGGKGSSLRLILPLFWQKKVKNKQCAEWTYLTYIKAKASKQERKKMKERK